MSVDRRSFLFGSISGVAVGGATALGSAWLANPQNAQRASGGFVEYVDDYKPSYAQQGEDLILANIFLFLRIETPTYIDIGAHEPVTGNNTYLFYKRGSRGVLVEPNPALTPKLRRIRPQDKVLEIGIGATGQEETEADYYIIKGDGQANTFSQETVAKLKAQFGEKILAQTIKRKLVNINKVLADNFPPGGPDLFSTDTEGYDLTILGSLDFDRFRPKVFCVETLDDFVVVKPILDLMESKDYEVRGATFVNTIFVDRRYLRDVEKRVNEARAEAARAK
jgi:FkbM family methyltransferase